VRINLKQMKKDLQFFENGGIINNMNEQNKVYGFFQKTLHDVEEAKRNLNYEVGTLISPDGRVIKEYGGEAHGINIPETDNPLFEGNIFTHNHPGGGNFTVQDIKTFSENKLYEVRASTPQGTYIRKGRYNYDYERNDRIYPLSK